MWNEFSFPILVNCYSPDAQIAIIPIRFLIVWYMSSISFFFPHFSPSTKKSLDTVTNLKITFLDVEYFSFMNSKVEAYFKQCRLLIYKFFIGMVECFNNLNLFFKHLQQIIGHPVFSGVTTIVNLDTCSISEFLRTFKLQCLNMNVLKISARIFCFSNPTLFSEYNWIVKPFFFPSPL